MTTPDRTNWQPPQGYIPVESQLEGVVVYAPRQEEVKPEEPVTYKCPNCGAATRFDVAAGGVACEHCGYIAETQVERVGRRADEFEFRLDTLSAAAQGWGVARQELHCDSCGANISIEAQALTVTCPFCASNRVNVRAELPELLRPRFLIPFQVEKQDVRTRAGEWLGQGWMHPQELRQFAALDQFNGIYLPFWTFDADITANWRAEVGHERQESYYDPGSKEWRTRTVVDWRWEDGQVGLSIDDLLICGSTKLSRRILDRLYPFNLNSLVAYSPDYLAGWQAQAYDITLPDAWEMGKAEMRERAKDACYEDIASAHVRNFRMTADFDSEVWRYVLLPVYVAAYRFEEKVYQLMANGQTGEIAGQKPVAWWKIWLVIGLLLMPGVGLGLISLPLLLVGGIGLPVLILALILLVIGGILSVLVYRKAVDSEAD